MRSSRVWMLCLLLLSLMAWPMPAQSTTSSTPEQIVSAIDPALWYPGSQVRDALLQVIQIGQEEIRRTAEEAVKVAVAPLLADNAQLAIERDLYKAKYEEAANALGWGIIGGGAAGLLLTLLFAVLVR